MGPNPARRALVTSLGEVEVCTLPRISESFLGSGDVAQRTTRVAVRRIVTSIACSVPGEFRFILESEVNSESSLSP